MGKIKEDKTSEKNLNKRDDLPESDAKEISIEDIEKLFSEEATESEEKPDLLIEEKSEQYPVNVSDKTDQTEENDISTQTADNKVEVDSAENVTEDTIKNKDIIEEAPEKTHKSKRDEQGQDEMEGPLEQESAERTESGSDGEAGKQDQIVLDNQLNQKTPASLEETSDEQKPIGVEETPAETDEELKEKDVRLTIKDAEEETLVEFDEEEIASQFQEEHEEQIEQTDLSLPEDDVNKFTEEAIKDLFEGLPDKDIGGAAAGKDDKKAKKNKTFRLFRGKLYPTIIKNRKLVLLSVGFFFIGGVIFMGFNRSQSTPKDILNQLSDHEILDYKDELEKRRNHKDYTLKKQALEKELERRIALYTEKYWQKIQSQYQNCFRISNVALEQKWKRLENKYPSLLDTMGLFIEEEIHYFGSTNIYRVGSLLASDKIIIEGAEKGMRKISPENWKSYKLNQVFKIPEEDWLCIRCKVLRDIESGLFFNEATSPEYEHYRKCFLKKLQSEMLPATINELLRKSASP
jgi:hypothetical protein